MGDKVKVILCGYNWTGCKALDLLKRRGYEVYVYTHEMENYCADLEGMCIKGNIPYTLEKITLKNLPFIPDIICSIYYRYLIEEEVITCVNSKIFNLHPSLLPNYRGCSSLTWAMINGEPECGFTYHYIDKQCDTGNIILQKKIPIEDFDTQGTLYNRVMFQGMEDFYKAFDLVLEGYEGVEQKSIGSGSYYKRGCPYDGILDTDSTEKADKIIRALINPPYKPAVYNGNPICSLKEFMRYKII